MMKGKGYIIAFIVFVVGLFLLLNKKEKSLQGLKDDFSDFVDKALRYKNYQDDFLLGYVSKNLAREIKKRTGIETLDYKIVVYADKIRHVINSHGNEKREKKRGQLPVNAEIIKLIPDVITDFHYISKGKGILEGKNADAIKIHKFLNGEIILTFEIFVDYEKQKLEFKTLLVKDLGR